MWQDGTAHRGIGIASDRPPLTAMKTPLMDLGAVKEPRERERSEAGPSAQGLALSAEVSPVVKIRGHSSEITTEEIYAGGGGRRRFFGGPSHARLPHPSGLMTPRPIGSTPLLPPSSLSPPASHRSLLFLPTLTVTHCRARSYNNSNNALNPPLSLPRPGAGPWRHEVGFWSV